MLKSESTRRTYFRFALVILLSTWILGFITPCFQFKYFASFYPFQKLIYSNVCHQNIQKSFSCDNNYFFVCARCTGIYFGAFMALLTILIFKVNKLLKTKYLYFFSVPMILDVAFQFFNVYDYNKIVSSITGFLFGSAVFIYILNGIENLLFIHKENK